MPRKRLKHILISTKLNSPSVDANLVHRPRLIALLNNGLGKRLTLISAPAGFGKTTLAVQWLDKNPRPFAWLSLDKNDSDPAIFLLYFLSAVQRVVPDFGASIKPLLSSAKLPPFDYLADGLISELTALPHPIVLVLDDYQVISCDAVQQILSRLVEQLPDKLHMVIISRIDPPWPMGRYRVRQWLNELRAADLSFTEEETRSFFKPFKLASEKAEMLQKRTEGWVAGLQLLKLSIVDEQLPENIFSKFSDSDKLIVDYLMDEVLSHQSSEILDFFVITALFDRFCAPLVDFLLEDALDKKKSRHILDFLENQNLFLVPLDRDGLWYRYHHLFQSLLLSHMKERISPEQRIRFYQHAGKWFTEAGLIEEAIRSYLNAGDAGSAADVFEENFHFIIDGDMSRQLLKRLIDMFPESTKNQSPAFLLARVYQKLVLWDFDQMRILTNAADRLLKDPSCTISEKGRKSLQGDISLLSAYYHYWRGDIKTSLSHGQKALQDVPLEHVYASTLALIYNAGALALSGRKNDALKLLNESLSKDCTQGSHKAGIFLMAKASIHHYAGDFDAVKEDAQQIHVIHETVPVPDYWRCYGHYFLGVEAYERNFLDAAEEHFLRAGKLRYRVSTRLYQDGLIGLALVCLAKGDTDNGRRYCDAAHAFALESSDPYSFQISNSFRTRFAIFSGEFPPEPFDYEPFIDSKQFWLEIPSLTRIEYLINKATPEDCEAALRLIEDALQQAQKHHNTPQVIKYLAVRALALKCLAKQQQAIEVIQKTIELAKPLGFLRTFVDRGPCMAELLSDLSAKRPQNRYLKSLLGAFGDKPPVETTAVFSVDHRSTAEQAADAFLSSGLSNRELDVLELLRKRLTDKEIAQRLFISHQTVKKHTASIYRKMNVAGRRQAVSAAQKMDILKAK